MQYLLRLIACFALLTATTVQADLPMAWIIEHADKQGNERTQSQIYLVGVVDGLGWANAELANNGEKMLFCQPDELALAPEQIVSIFMAFAKNGAAIAKHRRA